LLRWSLSWLEHDLIFYYEPEKESVSIAAEEDKENLARADAFERQITQGIDEYITQTGMEVEANRTTAEALSNGATATKPILTLDLQAAGISTIIWASGYQLDFGWVQIPVFDEVGYPVHQRGITAFPGLYFLGLSWLYKRKSALLYGVGEDAAFIASAIADRGWDDRRRDKTGREKWVILRIPSTTSPAILPKINRDECRSLTHTGKKPSLSGVADNTSCSVMNNESDVEMIHP
jgi:hypothetical protein